MLEKLKSIVEKMSDSKLFDASVFNDEVAMQTSWSPAKGGGSNFHTHKLVEIGHQRLEFVPTLWAKLFCGVFATVGAGIVFLEFFIGIGDQHDDPFWGSLFAYLFGLLFFGVGAGLYYYKALPRVFDKFADLYWKGHKKPVYMFDSGSGGEFARLSEIHAIQIISERIRSDNSTYTSYELNLVLKNGERMNVVDHGKKSAILADAKKLAAFLGKPVWDAADIM